MQIPKSIILFIGALLAVVSISNGCANEIEDKFLAAGLVDIHAIDDSIAVDLVNSDPAKNFFRENYYQGLNRAFLRKRVALQLSAAQKHLKSNFPEYSILIMDAARPRSVSALMFNKMQGTKFEKYVANPQSGSMHNYGVAVDVSIVDVSGKEIDMGFTPFFKNDLAISLGFVKGKIFGLSETQQKNRELLANIMKNAGFQPLSHEWWHFDGMPKDEARKTYQIIE